MNSTDGRLLSASHLLTGIPSHNVHICGLGQRLARRPHNQQRNGHKPKHRAACAPKPLIPHLQTNHSSKNVKRCRTHRHASCVGRTHDTMQHNTIQSELNQDSDRWVSSRLNVATSAPRRCRAFLPRVSSFPSFNNNAGM